VYTVPAGQEDALFGRDVVANVRITWMGTTSRLFINEKLVATTSGYAKAANWSSLSALTIGARSIRYAGGGYYASDDAIANFRIR
jgi:hypothetical protein